jgi:hypothetical protein
MGFDVGGFLDKVSVLSFVLLKLFCEPRERVVLFSNKLSGLKSFKIFWDYKALVVCPTFIKFLVFDLV